MASGVFAMTCVAHAPQIAGSRRPGRIESQNDKTAAWTIGYKKGDSSLHRRTVTISWAPADGSPGGSMVMRTVERVEIRDVTSKGDATIETSVTSLEFESSGRTRVPSGARFAPLVQVFARTGLLVRTEEGPPPSAAPIDVVADILSNDPVPSGAVRPDAVWRTSLQNRLAANRPATMVTRFVGATAAAGGRIINTAFTVDVPAPSDANPDMSIQIAGERTREVYSGRIVRFKAEIRNVPISVEGRRSVGAVTIEDDLAGGG